ncbi:MAG: hypothetical protein COA78_33170, partial [Blastopirellula sp.]
DFEQAVSSWVDAGEKIVIMMDANSDVRDGELATMLKSRENRQNLVRINILTKAILSNALKILVGTPLA